MMSFGQKEVFQNHQSQRNCIENMYNFVVDTLPAFSDEQFWVLYSWVLL